MRAVLKLVLVTCISAITAMLCAQAHAQSAALAAVQPFRPQLTVNKAANLCDPFLKAWTGVFDGKAAFDEGSIDPAVVYPSAKVSTVPPDKKGFYNRSDQLRIDFDNDGDIEVLQFEDYSVGWRYLGVRLYLFASEADFQVAAASKEHQRYDGSLHLDGNANPVPGVDYRLLFSYNPIGRAVIIEMSGHVYTLFEPFHIPTETSPQTVRLVQLDAIDSPQTVCSVDIFPAKSTFAAFRDSSPLFLAVRDIYGGSSGNSCLGTLGWTAPPLDVTLPMALFRPWAIQMPAPPLNEKEKKDLQREDAARELRYLSWALTDPQSWRDYLELKASRIQFITDLRAYYLNGFTKSEDEAERMAEWAWRNVLDKLIYSRTSDGFHLTWTALRNDADLPITPDSSPGDIARISIAAWQEMQVNVLARGETSKLPDRSIWRDALYAAVYTRQPMELIRYLASINGIRRAHDGYGIDPQSRSSHNFDDENARLLSQVLIASLGHTGFTSYFLERGANPDAGTNDFGKTPLMYAAQHDLMNAVELLIANKVDVNIATQSTEYSCVNLERDHRTALMYAAENASPQVIEAIIAAGADITAKDTKGNTVAWYFERNRKVADPATRTRILKLLGG